MKLEIINSNNWLEATWYEEVQQEENVTKVQVHCESFSGHKEHIEMLRNKAKEYGTSLDEYEDVIKEVSDSFVYPTQEELDKEELAKKIQEYTMYLAATDWYVTRLAETNKAIPEDVLAKRIEAREFLSNNKGE